MAEYYSNITTGSHGTDTTTTTTVTLNISFAIRLTEQEATEKRD